LGSDLRPGVSNQESVMLVGKSAGATTTHPAAAKQIMSA
jgi:hypothetical protein